MAILATSNSNCPIESMQPTNPQKDELLERIHCVQRSVHQLLNILYKNHQHFNADHWAAFFEKNIQLLNVYSAEPTDLEKLIKLNKIAVEKFFPALTSFFLQNKNFEKGLKAFLIRINIDHFFIFPEGFETIKQEMELANGIDLLISEIHKLATKTDPTKDDLERLGWFENILCTKSLTYDQYFSLLRSFFRTQHVPEQLIKKFCEEKKENPVLSEVICEIFYQLAKNNYLNAEVTNQIRHINRQLDFSQIPSPAKLKFYFACLFYFTDDSAIEMVKDIIKSILTTEENPETKCLIFHLLAKAKYNPGVVTFELMKFINQDISRINFSAKLKLGVACIYYLQGIPTLLRAIISTILTTYDNKQLTAELNKKRMKLIDSYNALYRANSDCNDNSNS